jgi:transcriptional regulator with XRE-family HTH domain
MAERDVTADPADPQASWGRRVQQRRTALNLTQLQLAERCGLTQQTISKIERNAIVPRDRVKRLIAQKLGTSVAELFPWPEKVA